MKLTVEVQEIKHDKGIVGFVFKYSHNKTEVEEVCIKNCMWYILLLGNGDYQ